MKKTTGSFKKLLTAFLIFSFLYSCSLPGEKSSDHPTVTPRSYTIVISQMKFTPEDLTINRGDTVTWLNSDMVEHNITEAANKEWSSAGLLPGKKWSTVAQKSYDYYCSIHPVMKGKLQVR
jgi:plastocyanin